MMSPDIEQQQDEYSDEMEMVGYPQHRGKNGRSARSKRNGNGTYQVVDEDMPLSSFDEDDDYHDNAESYVSEDGEADGLISQLSTGDHHSRVIGGSESGSTNLDDYFMYGFSSNSAGDSSIDWRCAFWLGISFLLAACLAVILPSFNNFGKPIVQEDGTVIYPNGTTMERNQTSHAVRYTCPVPETVEDAQNYANSSVEESYNNRTAEIESNFTGFLDTFHEAEFDGWGKTYDFVKAGMYHWKSTRFPKNLKDGDTIYESASGIGLNLIMTLEILQEVKGINNLIVYGNEYLGKSANTSSLILDALLPSLNATKGSICTGDSTNLYFIPAASFDLVFTGYISTLLDPLDLKKGVKENYEFYETICKGDIWQDQKLAEVAQKRQEDWFRTWIGEMVRIAKPGAPIIVEQVSYPFCEAQFDWGGVNQDFWATIDDIDPTTVEFEDDRLFRKRYHVFMRKIGFNATDTQSSPVNSVAKTTPASSETSSSEDNGGE